MRVRVYPVVLSRQCSAPAASAAAAAAPIETQSSNETLFPFTPQMLRYKAAAERGDWNAMHRLGEVMIDERHRAVGPEHFQRAVVYLETAAQKGVHDAYLSLGKCLMRIDRTEEALAALQKASELGLHDASALIADHLISSGNVAEGIKRWTQLAVPERPDFMISLAVILLSSSHILKPSNDYAQALTLLNTALTSLQSMLKQKDIGQERAEELIAQIARGQLFLAMCFRNGYAVPRDDFRAVELFESAAELGSAMAMYELALCVLKAHGTMQDPERAMVLLRQAASLNHPDAMFALATDLPSQYPPHHTKNLPEDVGLPRRIRQALVHRLDKLPPVDRETQPLTRDQRVQMLVRASVLGHVPAMVRLGNWLITGHDIGETATTVVVEKGKKKRRVVDRTRQVVDRDVGRGIEVLISAAARGSDEAAVMLSHIYANDEYVSADIERAVGFLVPAVARRYPPALLDYGLCLLAGKGVTQDISKGRELLSQAHRAGLTEASEYLEMSRTVDQGRTQA